MNFPDTRYMGSKRKLLPALQDIFEQLKFETALDAFSGTSSVSYLLKKLNKEVHSNDYLRFNHVIAKALIENSASRLSAQQIEELLAPADDAEDFIETQFTNIYYSREDCRWLDQVMSNVGMWAEGGAKSIALAALCRACIKKRPRGIYTYTGMRYDDGRKDLKLSLAEHFRDAVELFNASIFNNGRKNRSFNQDIMKFKRNQYDLVYMDPPYFSLRSDNEYSRRYHFLEGLVSYWSHVEIDHSTKTKKIKRVESDFTVRSRVVPAFEALFEKFKKSQLVISYSSNSIPDAELMTSILKNSGKAVELIELDYTYSVGTHRHKKANLHNRVKEYVFLGI